MNRQHLDETLYQKSIETIEGLAWMFPVDAEECPAQTDDVRPFVAISFSGPFEGELRLSASPSVLPILVGNMLGLDDDFEPNEGRQQDALKELTNVICGNLLPALAGPGPIFEIHSPRWLEIIDTEDQPASHEPASTVRLLLDSGILEIDLCVSDPAVLLTDKATEKAHP